MTNSTERTSKWFKENKTERVQVFINPKTEPELLEAYLYLVEHYGGKKEAIGNAVIAEYKKLKKRALKKKSIEKEH